MDLAKRIDPSASILAGRSALYAWVVGRVLNLKGSAFPGMKIYHPDIDRGWRRRNPCDASLSLALPVWKNQLPDGKADYDALPFAIEINDPEYLRRVDLISITQRVRRALDNAEGKVKGRRVACHLISTRIEVIPWRQDLRVEDWYAIRIPFLAKYPDVATQPKQKPKKSEIYNTTKYSFVRGSVPTDDYEEDGTPLTYAEALWDDESAGRRNPKRNKSNDLKHQHRRSKNGG